jgi:hypothetical protein
MGFSNGVQKVILVRAKRRLKSWSGVRSQCERMVRRIRCKSMEDSMAVAYPIQRMLILLMKRSHAI